MKKTPFKRGTKKLGKAKSPHKVWEDLLDDLWRTIIYLRHKGICAYTQQKGKDAHHIVTRKCKNTRWDTRNGILLRAMHNMSDAHLKPEKFRRFLLDQHFTQKEYDLLQARSEMRWDRDRSAIELYLTEEIKKLATLPEDWKELSLNKKKLFLKCLRQK